MLPADALVKGGTGILNSKRESASAAAAERHNSIKAGWGNAKGQAGEQARSCARTTAADVEDCTLPHWFRRIPADSGGLRQTQKMVCFGVTWANFTGLYQTQSGGVWWSLPDSTRTQSSGVRWTQSGGLCRTPPD